MVISITITAVAFLAIASVMGSGLKALALQKARTQGNEVATQGIEDLQRYAFANLAVCGAPTGGTIPSEFALTVVSTSTSCPTGTAADKANHGDDPCSATATATGIPRASYRCTRINVTYNVRRFVAWTDEGRTAKRLAVYVDWTDQLGHHTVSQQSSLRSPASGDVEGIARPGFVASSSNPTVSTYTSETVNGVLQTGIVVTAQTTGLSDRVNDRVFVSYSTVSPEGDITTGSTALSPTPNSASWDKKSWSGTIGPNDPAGVPIKFPDGTQFLTLTAVRASDGKTGSLIDTTSPTGSRFCPGANASVCPADLPSFSLSSGVLEQNSGARLDVSIDSSGALTGNGFSILATTKNVLATDRVSVLLVTRSGSFRATMAVDNGKPCNADDQKLCTWTTTVLPSAGLAFDPTPTGGPYPVAVVTAAQLGSSRSTAAAKTSELNFKVTA